MPLHHFAFFGPNMMKAEKVQLPLVEFATARQEDLAFFRTTRTPSADDQFDDFAALRPMAAILETRGMYEQLVRAAVAVLPDVTPGLDAVRMIDLLRDHGLIDTDTVNLLHKLRRFGNRAQHEPESIDATHEVAVQFRRDVETAAAALQSITTKLRAVRTSNDEFDTEWKGPPLL
jgi:hypothetical protein